MERRYGRASGVGAANHSRVIDVLTSATSCTIRRCRSGQAREVLKAYSRNHGMADLAGMTIALIEHRMDIESDLPLIQ